MSSEVENNSLLVDHSLVVCVEGSRHIHITEMLCQPTIDNRLAPSGCWFLVDDIELIPVPSGVEIQIQEQRRRVRRRVFSATYAVTILARLRLC